MTKERKIAIKIWEELKQMILDDTLPSELFFVVKGKLASNKYNMSWTDSCWFCQYVRREYDRFGDFWEKTGKAKGLGEEGCNLCPLAKAHPAYNPSDAGKDCGCILAGAPWRIVSNNCRPKEERAAACDIIIKALKGEHIEIQAPEEEA